jgi:hypothetical protein
MSGFTPCLRVHFGLRRPCNEQILADMEDFSTPSRAATPWIANLATLAVVIAAIGWSSEQRPTAQLAQATAPAPASTPAQPMADTKPMPALAAPQPRWPAQATSLPADGMQIVSLQPVKLR